MQVWWNIIKDLQHPRILQHIENKHRPRISQILPAFKTEIMQSSSPKDRVQPPSPSMVASARTHKCSAQQNEAFEEFQ